jgi:hypothetical protein
VNAPSVHDDWLSLIEISGPFLAVPVLKEAFPQGLEELDATKRKRLRQAYEEWREALELEDAQLSELHVAWIDEVLSRGLELDEDDKGDVLKRADWCAAKLHAILSEHNVTLSPDFAVIDEQRGNKPLLLIQTYAHDTDLDVTRKQDGWAATPADRMVQLCRSLGCRLGLVTNGERWMLVDAPVGAVTTFAGWYARIWGQEPITLQAFVHLLGIRRFFVDESEQLPALFDRSLKFQDEVTDALGEQVRRAVEVLIQTLDKADQDRNRELLHDVKEPELYEAVLTVMMRLVFLLSAEERGLLLMGDERYEANYALSTLRMQLRKESEEILERRWDAWSRLLAIFRAVFGGIEHENLRLPALGGSLFDPDRFPFLEGRAKGSSWRSDAAKPLPIDNRTVLLLLEAIQQFQGRTLSYRALDVEQIGYVYEGLLERTVKRTDEVTLELDATKSAKTPWIKLAELDSVRLDGVERLADLLQERSGSSVNRVRNDLDKPVDDTLADRLLTACQGDTKLRNRVKPYAHLLRTDPWGYPLVYPAGAFIVTTGSDRRETGTHYTPKSLTEAIVAETLTPVAYVGPAEGTPREQWALKSPAELLDLKICDPAMGSGAFLVQACRWLSDRLVDAWSQVEATGKTVSVDGEVLEEGVAKEPLPQDSEARTVIARRLIAERCLYGVDLNPLAVELAKLSIWLVTLAKGRPFGFLDHNLRCGDSLLGIHRLDQLTELSMTPGGKGQQRLFGKNIEKAVHEAIELRHRLRKMPIRDIHDVEAMAQLDADARKKLEVAEAIANAFIGEVFASGGFESSLDNAIASLTIKADRAVDGAQDAYASIIQRISTTLSAKSFQNKSRREPFHWPLAFPEVFLAGGFSAVLGNPPYMAGRLISGKLDGLYLSYLSKLIGENPGQADLCTHFLRRAFTITREKGMLGLLTTNTISQGDSSRVGLQRVIEAGGTLIFALASMRWPGKAAVVVSYFAIYKDEYLGKKFLDGQPARNIDHQLKDIRPLAWERKILEENIGLASKGFDIGGDGFLLSDQERHEIIARSQHEAALIHPHLNGKELYSFPDLQPKRFIISFLDWPITRAQSYPVCLDRVERKVKPYRDTVNRKSTREKWWIYNEDRPTLRGALQRLPHVIAKVLTSNTWAFARLPSSYSFDQALIVFFFDSYAHFSLLQSTVHEVWAKWNPSTMKTDARYTIADCFSTFPMPLHLADNEGLKSAGQAYDVQRSRVMTMTNEGLTKIYSRFHNPSDNDPEICKLRELHTKIDNEVALAYGWSLNLEHGFHEVPYLSQKGQVRFTISEDARFKVLGSLLEINQERFNAESTAGGGANATTKPKRVRREETISQTFLTGLFAEEKQ